MHKDRYTVDELIRIGHPVEELIQEGYTVEELTGQRSTP